MATTPATNPISPARFAEAILDLPFSNLYTKAAELRNSISHLKSSNTQMLPFADEGDDDCREAMFENLAVIGRLNERLGLLRLEVERRGGVWSEHAVGENGGVGGLDVDGEGVVVGAGAANGIASNGASGGVNGDVVNGGATRAPSGRLTDEELRRQMEARMGGDGNEEEEDGVHL